MWILLFTIFNLILWLDVGIKFYNIKFKNTPTENPALIASGLAAGTTLFGVAVGCHRDTLSADLDENIGTANSNLHHHHNPFYTK